MISASLKSKLNRDGWLAILATLAVAIYFWRFSRYGLQMGATHDDLMNLGRAIRDSYSGLLGDIVCLWRFSPSFRPLGGLFYLGLYDWFGFQPAAFRATCLTLMAANLVLIFWFARLMANREIAFFTVLLLAYKTGWPDLYSNTGYCYDLLCFPLYFGALLVYFRARLAGRLLTTGELAAFVALVWLGLNTKEMIVSVPAVVGGAELFWLDRKAPLLRRLAPAVIASAAVLLFLFGRLYSPEGLGKMAAYTPDFSTGQFLKQGRRFLIEFFSLPGDFPGWLLLAMFAALLAAAFWRPSIRAKVATAIALLGVLPVIFIPNRGLAAAYIPSAGLALLIGSVLISMARKQAALVFLVAFAGLWYIAVRNPPNIPERRAQADEVQRATDGIRALDLHPPRDARILMERDPIPSFRWASTFLFWILFDDPTISVDWVSEPEPGQESYQHYAVLTTTPDGRIVRVR